MLTLLKQEFMKAWKQNRLYVWAIMTFLVPVIVLPTLISAAEQASNYMPGSWGGGEVIVVIGMSVLAALSFSQEFTFGTIRPLLSRQYSRLQIFISKVLMVFFEFLILEVMGFLGTLVGRQIFIAINGSEGTAIDFKGLFVNWSVEILSSLFFIAVVLLVANIAKSSAAAISLGIVIQLATPIVSAIATSLVGFWDGLKWNPFTVLEYVAGYNYDIRQQYGLMIKLAFGADLWVLFAVFIGYLVLMFGLAYWIFDRRSV